MKRLAVRFGIIGVVVAIGAIVGMRQDKVLDYNDLVVNLHNESEAQFSGYTNLMGDWYDGQTIDMAVIRQELTLLEQAHQDAYEQLHAVEVPDHDECRTLQASLEEYLDMDKEFIVAYRTVTDYIDQHNPGAETDFLYVSAILDPISEEQSAILERVQANQHAMAKKFDFEIR